MKFLPYENFYIITSLKPVEVQQLLGKKVELPQKFSFKSMFSGTSGYYFTGYVGNEMFEFKRIIYYRNSFLPEVKGTIEPALNGSRIHVKMSMQTVVTIFMCAWLGFALFFGIGFLIQESNKGPFEFVNLMPFLMFLFGYLLTTGGFKYESIKAKQKLLEFLDGEIEK